MKRIPNHDLTLEEKRKGGKNGKRGPSIKKLFEKFLQGDVPAVLKKAVENRAIIQRGKYYKLNKRVLAKKMDTALTMAILNEAMAGEGWAAKLIVEQIDGVAKSNDTLNVNVLTAEKIAESDSKAKAALEKYNLEQRGKKVE